MAVLVSVSAIGEAQTGSMRISLPSPTVASLGKFGDVPVSLYTGTPDITVPLFSAQGRTLELPIALKYHASGIRVQEIGGWVGIGWSLDAGGVITRTVRGLVDESANGYYNTGHVLYNGANWPAPTPAVIDNIANEQLDAEPDQFFFSFAGRSGQFVMGPTSTSSSLKEFRAIPYQKLRIEPTAGFASWIITTEDGTRYTFAAAETNTDYNLTLPGSQIPAHYGESYTSAWHLTEVRSPGGDVITLSYAPYTVRHQQATYREKFDDRVSAPGAPACVPVQFDVINEYEVAAKRLVSITTAAHTISFNTGVTLRTDALSPSGAQQEPRLDNIVVSTPGGTVLRRSQLEHDYSTGRLTLRNVYEQDRNGVSLPPYSFTYASPSVPSLTSYAIDHWGYFNGKTSNTTFIPPATTPSGTNLPGADRSPDPAYMRAGALTRITYPTGGYNEFVYEANDYGGIGGSGSAPMDFGPPQSAMVQSNAYQGPKSTTFTVGGTEAITATVTVSLDPACGPLVGCPYAKIDGKGQWHQPGTYYVTLAPGTYTARASEEWIGGFAMITVDWRNLGTVKKKTAGALRVSELRTADAMGNVMVRKYKYTLQSDTTKSSGVINSEPAYTFQYSTSECSYFSRSSTSKMPLGGGPPVGYREVTVWHGVSGEFGKTRHAFRSVIDAQDDPVSGIWPYSTRTAFEWKRGQQVNATEHNAAGQPQRRSASVHVFRDEGTPEPTTTRRFRGLSIHSFSAGQLGSAYFYHPYEVVSAWSYVGSDTTTIYNESGSSSFAMARSYSFANPIHTQLTEMVETNSDGTQRITRMKYPADYATGTGNAEAAAITDMQGPAHMHSPAIERWVVKRVGGADSVVQADLTTFKQYSPGRNLPYETFTLNSATPLAIFVPSTVSGGTFTMSASYKRLETVNTYDAWGRPDSLTDARAKAITYLYGGNANAAFLIRVKRIHDASGSVDLTTEISYDGDGFVSSIKDEGGSFRYFTYDLFGRLRQVKNHNGAIIKAYGYAYSRTSPNWTFNSSIPNAIVDTTFVQHSPTEQRLVSTGYLDGLGRLIQTVTQDGSSYVVAATQYDGMGRLWRTWKPYTRVTAGFDPSFAVNTTNFYNTYHSSSLAKPYIETQYTADALSRPRQITPEFIGTTPTAFVVNSYGVDAAAKHQFTEATDESGKKQRGYVDLFGGTVKAILGYGTAEATTTLKAFDVAGQLRGVTDPRGLLTSYTLNTRGQLVHKAIPDAGAIAFKYDAGGNLRYSQDANQSAAGKVQFSTFDFANRPIISGVGTTSFASLDPDAASAPALETSTGNWLEVRHYDQKPSTTSFPWSAFSSQIAPLALSNVSGRLAATASKSNGAWQVSLFSYDADGQVATHYTFTQANGGASVLTAVNTTVTYVRDLRGALTERRLTIGANAFNHWWEYDGRGLLWKTFASSSSTKPATPDVIYTYRPSGQVQDRQFLGGPAVPVRYTIREQVEKIGDPAVTTYPFAARYAYHANGTVSEAEFYNAGSPAAAKRYRYTFQNYDALNRLKSADFSSWSGSGWTATLAHDLTDIMYDAAGNLTALKRYRETATLIDNLTYNYPANSNRLSSVADAASPSLDSWDAESGTFSYDANGNVLNALGVMNGLEVLAYDNQNLPLSVSSGEGTAIYRYDGAGQRIAKQVSGGNTEVYILDGAASLGVVTVNGSGSPVSWFFNIVAGDRVIGRQPNIGNRRYYHTDLLGSTRTVVEGTTVVESYDLDPWGLAMPGRTLAGGTKEGFTAKERDAETGLDYFGARYYIPALARWMSVDPLAEKHPEWSPYNYVLNNPLSLFDPDGRQARANNRGPLAPGGPFVRGPVRPMMFMGAAAQATPTLVVTLASLTPLDGVVSTANDALTGDLTVMGTAMNFLPGKLDAAEPLVKAARSAGHVGDEAANITVGTIRELQKAGLRDAHHVIQNAAVRDLPGYRYNDAIGVHLTGPASAPGTPHYRATQVQRQAGGGSYGAERRIAYKALLSAGIDKDIARKIIARADATFVKIHVTRETPTRIPGDRRK